MGPLNLIIISIDLHFDWLRFTPAKILFVALQNYFTEWKSNLINRTKTHIFIFTIRFVAFILFVGLTTLMDFYTTVSQLNRDFLNHRVNPWLHHDENLFKMLCVHSRNLRHLWVASWSKPSLLIRRFPIITSNLSRFQKLITFHFVVLSINMPRIDDLGLRRWYGGLIKDLKL